MLHFEFVILLNLVMDWFNTGFYKPQNFWQVSAVPCALWGICASKGRSHCLCDCCCSRHLLHTRAEGDHLSAAQMQNWRINRAFNFCLTSEKFSQTQNNWPFVAYSDTIRLVRSALWGSNKVSYMTYKQRLWPVEGGFGSKCIWQNVSTG